MSHGNDLFVRKDDDYDKGIANDENNSNNCNNYINDIYSSQ